MAKWQEQPVNKSWEVSTRQHKTIFCLSGDFFITCVFFTKSWSHTTAFPNLSFSASLSALKHANLDHVVAVVIRFYGGVKLGTGNKSRYLINT